MREIDPNEQLDEDVEEVTFHSPPQVMDFKTESNGLCKLGGCAIVVFVVLVFQMHKITSDGVLEIFSEKVCTYQVYLKWLYTPR